MIIDSHTSVPPDFLRAHMGPQAKLFEKVTVKSLLERMEGAGIDFAILWSIARTPEQAPPINDWIHNVVKEHPDKFIDLANVYPPKVKEAKAELDRAITKLEMRGLKLHPEVQKFHMNDPTVLEIIDRAKEYNIPIVIHVASPAYTPFPSSEAAQRLMAADEKEPYSKSAYLPEIINRYNTEKIYAAHMGGIYDREIQRSRISFQTTGACVEAIEYAVKTIGAERVVYGSDFPFFEPLDELNKVKKANITEKEKKNILGENIKNIFRL